ncbi:hypothetical protein [Plantactinospora sp. KLBMP9567]|uniref:hypothetical protein n=1 Tax=Plantactinospora sp. KLBMP9567 TaxID=3085900 RepID=UPI0039906458
MSGCSTGAGDRAGGAAAGRAGRFRAGGCGAWKTPTPPCPVLLSSAASYSISSASSDGG